jgi:hypothetical protein
MSYVYYYQDHCSVILMNLKVIAKIAHKHISTEGRIIYAYGKCRIITIFLRGESAHDGELAF